MTEDVGRASLARIRAQRDRQLTDQMWENRGARPSVEEESDLPQGGIYLMTVSRDTGLPLEALPVDTVQNERVVRPLDAGRTTYNVTAMWNDDQQAMFSGWVRGGAGSSDLGPSYMALFWDDYRIPCILHSRSFWVSSDRTDRAHIELIPFRDAEPSQRPTPERMDGTVTGRFSASRPNVREQAPHAA